MIQVVPVEKETEVGLHASGRNSGVLHAGFYYSPDSLKAKLTVDGNRLLREFCAENNVEVKQQRMDSLIDYDFTVVDQIEYK